MNGNYNQNIDESIITFADIENFLTGLLEDVAEGSNNTLLSQNTQISPLGDYNLNTLNLEPEPGGNPVKMLATFRVNIGDPRNVNLYQKLKDSGDKLKVVYEIGAIVQTPDTDYQTFLEAYQVLISSLTNNWNTDGTSPTAQNYEAFVKSGIKLSTPLSQNEADLFPEISKGEDPDQINYLTALTNIAFIIIKK